MRPAQLADKLRLYCYHPNRHRDPPEDREDIGEIVIKLLEAARKTRLIQTAVEHRTKVCFRSCDEV